MRQNYAGAEGDFLDVLEVGKARKNMGWDVKSQNFIHVFFAHKHRALSKVPSVQ